MTSTRSASSPFRLAEMLWPSVFGTSFGRNAYWIDALRSPAVRQKIWVPSLYIGALGLVLALGALTFRRGRAPAGLALLDRRGQPDRQPGSVHQPDLGGPDARARPPASGSRTSARWTPTTSPRSGSIATSGTGTAASTGG